MPLSVYSEVPVTYPPGSAPYPIVPQRRTNGLGIAGFVVSLVGIFTLGLLCPIGLLLSFIALFRAPRGFAIAGLIIGLLGSLELTIIVAVFGMFGLAAFSCISVFMSPQFKTGISIEEARHTIEA